MASVEIDTLSLRAQIYEEIVKKSALVFEAYNATPMLKDDPNYPFEDRHESEGSVKDPAAQSVHPTTLGARIQIEAAGAVYSEFGNDPERPAGTDSKGGKKIKSPRTRAELAIALTQAGSRLAKDPSSGRMYFVTESVESYAGKHYFENAVRAVFGFGPRP